MHMRARVVSSTSAWRPRTICEAQPFVSRAVVQLAARAAALALERAIFRADLVARWDEAIGDPVARECRNVLAGGGVQRAQLHDASKRGGGGEDVGWIVVHPEYGSEDGGSAVLARLDAPHHEQSSWL